MLYVFRTFVYTLNGGMRLCCVSAVFISSLSSFVIDLQWNAVIHQWHDGTFYFGCCIFLLGCVWLKCTVLLCRVCLFLNVWLEQGGNVLQVNKRHIEKWKGKRRTLPLSYLWLSPVSSQTLAHWLLPAPHCQHRETFYHRNQGITGQPAFLHGCTIPNLEWPQMADDCTVGMQDVPKASDCAPCCLWNISVP